MRVRSQLLFAFFLLAIVPLAGIVGYSYSSSRAALWRATAAEAAAAAVEMDGRLAEVREELQRGVARVGELPLEGLLDEGHGSPLAGDLLSAMGETAASLVDSLEIAPAAPVPRAGEVAPAPPVAATPATPPTPPAGAPSPAPPAPPPPQIPVVIDVEAIRRSLAAAGQELSEEREREILEAAREAAELAGDLHRRLAEQRAALDAARARELELRSEQGRLEGAIPPVAADTRWLQNLDVPVVDEGRVYRVAARVSRVGVLSRVLERSRERGDEIPFAIDEQGKRYTALPADEARLADLGLEPPPPGSSRVRGDWVVAVSSLDPASGIAFGVARPLGDALADLRRTAVRNLAAGAALIGLALLGIVPLSSRMSRRIEAITAGAERLALGDLTTRVTPGGGGEIARLAQAFNHMAEQLTEHQHRLLEQERSRQRQQLEKRLLEREYERTSRELEEARRFQLSLLPRQVPRPGWVELAAAMRTATEVGGDYYDFQLDEGGSVLVAVGDAAGHGARAGTLVAVVKGLFTSHAPGRGGLGRFLGEASAGLRSMELGRMFVAFALARLSPDKLTVAMAGMPPVLVHRRETGEVEEVGMPSMPLGAMLESYGELSVALGPGDTVLLSSDGLPELLDAEGDPLGYATVRGLLAAAAESSASAEEVLARLLAAVDERLAGEAPLDDVTIVVGRLC